MTLLEFTFSGSNKMLLISIILWVPVADHAVRGDLGLPIRWSIPDSCKGSFLITNPKNETILEVTRFYSAIDASITMSRGCFDKHGTDTCMINGYVTIPGTYDVFPRKQSENFTCNQSFVVQPKDIHTKTMLVLTFIVAGASLVTLTVLFAVFYAKRIFKARIRQAAGRTVLQSDQSSNDVGDTEFDGHGINDEGVPCREEAMSTDIEEDPYTDNYDYPSPYDYPYYRMTSDLYLTPCSDSYNEGDYRFEHPQKYRQHFGDLSMYANAISDDHVRDSNLYITPVMEQLNNDLQDYKTFTPSKAYENRKRVEYVRLDNPVLNDDIENCTKNTRPTNLHDCLDNDGYLMPSG